MRAGAFLAVALLAPALAGCDPLTGEELRREVEAVGSIAAEGALVADSVAEDRTRITFIRVHASQLAEAAEEESEKLNDATPAAGLADRAAEGRDLAGSVSDELGRLVTSPGSEAGGADVARSLRELSDRATQEAEEL